MSDTITITDADITEALSEYGDYAPSLEALEDGGYLDAIRAILEMEAEENEGMTWLDQDPDVAWGADPETEPTYHGRLAAIYQSVGWGTCYHERGYRTRFHFNVKTGGGGAYRAFHARVGEVDDARQGQLDTDEVERIAANVEEWELRSWWEVVLPDRAHAFGVGEVRDPETRREVPATSWYSCGRSGGYVTMPDRYMTEGIPMVLMAYELKSSRDYYNGSDWGTYLADQAIERYDEDRLTELASPRDSAFHA